MRATLFLLVVLFSVLGCQTDNRRLINEVIVRKLDLDLPVDQEEAQQVLADNFMNKPEEMKFACLTIKEWRPRFYDYEKVLLSKAQSASLDSDSLRGCLTVVFEGAGDQKAYLPVGAYFARQAATPVWIVVVKWEDDVPPELVRLQRESLPRGVSRKYEFPTLGHIRVFVFDSRTHALITWMTCG